MLYLLICITIAQSAFIAFKYSDWKILEINALCEFKKNINEKRSIPKNIMQVKF